MIGGVRMFHRVKAVEPLPDMQLRVSFVDGSIKRYDVKPLLELWEPFKDLASVVGLFNQVQVDMGGYGISWNADIDLACDELWENGLPIQ